MAKTKKDFEKYILAIVKKYQPILLLQKHKVGVKFDPKIEFMACLFNYPYLDVDIFYSQRAFDEWKSGNLLRSPIIHELCHIITDPLYAKATSRYASRQEIEDERERLTDTICNIVRAYAP